MNNDQYKSSRDILEQAKISLSSDDFRTLNSIDIEVCSLLQKKCSDHSFDELTAEEKICLATFNAEGQVGSGGLFDFFQYTSDAEVFATLEGYETFGATDLLKLIQKAIKKFPKSPPLPDHTEREEILDVWFDKDKDPFSKLDKKFHDIGSALRERLKFVTERPEHFFNS